uniref:Uncharacterized protein n=1 Tax=Arundo donax TaxID=35708 RepID=A0A0A9BHF1_ARUDO
MRASTACFTSVHIYIHTYVSRQLGCVPSRPLFSSSFASLSGVDDLPMDASLFVRTS